MQTTGRGAARIAKLLVEFSWWTTIVASALYFGLILFWPLTSGTGLDHTVRAEVSVSDSVARAQLPVLAAGNGFAANVELERVTGSLELRPVRWRLLALRGVVAGATVIVTLFGLSLLRSFLGDVLRGSVFTAENATRLRRLAWLLILAGLIMPLLEFGESVIFIRAAQLTGTPLGLRVSSLGTVIPGLLLLVLASSWQYGVELQREQELTI